MTCFTKGLRPKTFHLLLCWATVPNDLIYEGITTAVDRCFSSDFFVPNDLIYEGITTHTPLGIGRHNRRVPNDLIYEGITTYYSGHVSLLGHEVPNDLIYEGITT